MSVAPEITRAIVCEELEAMAPLASQYGWTITSDIEQLTITVRMQSAIDSESYLVEAQCTDYKMLPPVFEFLHLESDERGSPRCYPADGSYFHQKPCICVQWNRKAYQQLGGPHNDWDMTSWISARPGMSKLGDMFLLIQLQINKKGQYKGRMAPLESR